MSGRPVFDGFDPITAPVTGGQYMTVLGERQRAWERNQPQAGVRLRYPALLEWFILPGEEDLVQLPETAPAAHRPRKARVYRSAESLRRERDRLVQRMEQVADAGDTHDRASTNLSPYSRSRAARNAGRRRFAAMDRALETYTRLNKRVTQLTGQISAAEARESGDAS